jgi:hypothetical protein
MNLFILDKDPRIAVDKLSMKMNKRFVFKQLIEACQLVCSAGISDEYQKIGQAKEIQKWILKNQGFTHYYIKYLIKWAINNINIFEKSIHSFNKIADSLISNNIDISSLIFRYSYTYHDTEYKSNTLIPIEIGIKVFDLYSVS